MVLFRRLKETQVVQLHLTLDSCSLSCEKCYSRCFLTGANPHHSLTVSQAVDVTAPRDEDHMLKGECEGHTCALYTTQTNPLHAVTSGGNKGPSEGQTQHPGQKNLPMFTPWLFTYPFYFSLLAIQDSRDFRTLPLDLPSVFLLHS
jgi:hypothetical protein